jgi:hypothetical protein
MNATSAVGAELWAGRIPVVFVLASNEVTSLTPPRPHYVRGRAPRNCGNFRVNHLAGSPQVMVPRVSYLPLSLFPVLSRFQDAVPALCGTKDLWFEHRGVPLRWWGLDWAVVLGFSCDCGPTAIRHVPFGVLYDQLSMDTHELPWVVTVHFQSFPSIQVCVCGFHSRHWPGL